MKRSFGARTIIHPTPVWVIGTYDKKRKPNAATVACGVYVAHNPHAWRSLFGKQHIHMEISWIEKLSQ